MTPHSHMNAPSSKHVHVTALFPELLGVGGVQEAGRLVALALDGIARERGWSYRLLGLNDPSGAQTLCLGSRTVSVQGFARAKAKFILNATRGPRAAQKGAAHVVLAVHPNLAPIAAAMQQSRATRALVMAHGIEVWKPLPPIRRSAIRRAFLVTGPSSDTVEKLLQVQKVSHSRVRRLPWPLNPDFLRLAETSGLPLPANFPSGRVILTIGRAAASEKYKGTDTLIRAIAEIQREVPDVHLVAIGGGDDEPRLRSLASELGVAACVRFMRGLSREHLAACYSRCEIFAMPSSGEGFGFVFLEAMAFGKPIIAAAAGGALDLVGNGENGLLVPAGEVAPLAAALRRLFGDERLRKDLGSRGRKLAREKYAFESFRANLEHLIQECAAPSTEST